MRGRKPKPISKQKQQVLCTRVNHELFVVLEHLAESQDLTFAQLVRRAVREYVDNQQKIQKVA